MPNPNAILVFAKLPEPGKVKTRLSSVLDPTQAAELHRACLEDTLALVRPLRGCQKYLYLASDGIALDWRASLPAIPADWKVTSQRGRDLGARLENAVYAAFRSGARRVAVIGTDIPWMGRRRIERALQSLHGADAVIGPALDGGYYLIGMRRWLPQLFRRMPWGTSRLFQATLRALNQTGLRYCLLPRDFDLDRPHDLERARALIKRGNCTAQALAEFLNT